MTIRVNCLFFLLIMANPPLLAETLKREKQRYESVKIIDWDNLAPVRQRLLAWAQAWNRGDAQAVINFYHSDYPSNRIDSKSNAKRRINERKKWLQQRRQRITPQRNIRVDILIRDISLSAPLSDKSNHVMVLFEQNYSANNYQDRVIKKMTWQYIDQDWYISKEQVLKILAD